MIFVILVALVVTPWRVTKVVDDSNYRRGGPPEGDHAADRSGRDPRGVSRGRRGARPRPRRHQPRGPRAPRRVPREDRPHRRRSARCRENRERLLRQSGQRPAERIGSHGGVRCHDGAAGGAAPRQRVPHRRPHRRRGRDRRGSARPRVVHDGRCSRVRTPGTVPSAMPWIDPRLHAHRRVEPEPRAPRRLLPRDAKGSTHEPSPRRKRCAARPTSSSPRHHRGRRSCRRSGFGRDST